MSAEGASDETVRGMGFGCDHPFYGSQQYETALIVAVAAAQGIRLTMNQADEVFALEELWARSES